jgi:CDP-diacylglycerol--serine O-phosphatidyltransferase
MIRGFHLADFLTLANAACGVLAVFAVMGYVEARTSRRLLVATALIPLALVFDVLDGRVARSRQKHSAMGRELDSLADVISFGVAPAAIAYGAGMKGLWDVVILVYFVCCGVSRWRASTSPPKRSRRIRARSRTSRSTPIPSSLVLSRDHRGGGLARPHRGSAALRRLAAGAGVASPLDAGLGAVRRAHDQQDDPHPQALTDRAPRVALTTSAAVRSRAPDP